MQSTFPRSLHWVELVPKKALESDRWKKRGTIWNCAILINFLSTDSVKSTPTKKVHHVCTFLQFLSLHSRGRIVIIILIHPQTVIIYTCLWNISDNKLRYTQCKDYNSTLKTLYAVYTAWKEEKKQGVSHTQ